MSIQFAINETPVATLSDRLAVLENLSELRREWEAATGGNLIEARGSVGLLLFDVTVKLDMTQEEQIIVLGKRLFREALDKSQT